MNSLLTKYSRPFIGWLSNIPRYIFFITCFLIVILYVITYGHIPKAYASSEIQKQMSIEVNVAESGDVSILMQTSFFVTEGTSLLREYNLSFINTTLTNFTAVSGNGTVLNHSIRNNEDVTITTIGIPDVRLNPNEPYIVKISYTIPAGLKPIGNLYKLLVPVFNTENTKVDSVTVKYNESLGELLYCSTSCVVTNSSELIEISLTNTESTDPFIIIGSIQNYILNIAMKVENNTGERSNLSTFIPTESCVQRNVINFFSPTPISIITDSSENNRLDVVLDPYSEKVIQYSGQVQLKRKVSDLEQPCLVPNAADLDYESLTILKLKLEQSFPNTTEPLEYIKKFYQKLVSESELNLQSGPEKDPFTNVEQFMSEKQHIFTKRELLEMLMVVYTAFDYPAYISYGFMFPYYVSEPIGVNHSWLTVYIDSVPLIVDPFMEIQSKMNGFNINLLDRVAIYNTQQLFDQSYSWQSLEDNFISLGYQNFATNPKIQMLLSFPESVQAGVPYSASILVQNQGNTLFKNLKIILTTTDGVSFEFPDNTNFISLLYPGQTVIIPVMINSTKGTFSQTHEILVSYYADNFATQTQSHSLTVSQKPINIVIAILITACIGSAGVLVFERMVKYFNKGKGENSETPYDPLLGFGSKNDKT